MINDTVSVELSGAEGTIYIVFGIYWSTSFGQSGFPSLVILFRPMLRFCAISILERSYQLGRTSTGGGELVTTAIGTSSASIPAIKKSSAASSVVGRVHNCCESHM